MYCLLVTNSRSFVVRLRRIESINMRSLCDDGEHITIMIAFDGEIGGIM